MTSLPTKRSRGRPAAFKPDEALAQALLTFWKYGYEGTSMADLTEAMGINKPSLYASFGNKEALFKQALEKYLAESVAYVRSAMRAPTARQVAENILSQSAAFLTDPAYPAGCMFNIGTLACGPNAAAIKQMLVAYRQRYETALRNRFELAQQQSDLPPEADPALLAKFVAAVHQGMSVQAVNGASKEELLAIAHMAMKSWPTDR